MSPNLLSSWRAALVLCLSVVLAASSGCSWFRASTGYEHSPESRPLEVPPDLDAPAVDRSMEIPATPSAGSSTQARGVQTGTSFVLNDSADGAWRRLGLALDRIEGVSITERAQLLSVYNVSYEGETFLVKVSAEGQVSRISAVSAEGRELTTGAAGRLLAVLRSRLG